MPGDLTFRQSRHTTGLTETPTRNAGRLCTAAVTCFNNNAALSCPHARAAEPFQRPGFFFVDPDGFDPQSKFGVLCAFFRALRSGVRGRVRPFSIIIFMASSQLENYIATHRKRSGLSQQDVAWILRAGDGSEISRYEMNRRLPTLETALSLEVLFGVPVGALFAGKRRHLALRIERRIVLHHRRVLAQPRIVKGRRLPKREAKLQWHLARRTHHPHIPA